MEHRIDDHVAVLESHPACRRKVLVGQLNVLSVKYLFFFIVEFLPNTKAGFHLQDVGGLAEVPRLDDADLKVETQIELFLTVSSLCFY